MPDENGARPRGRKGPPAAESAILREVGWREALERVGTAGDAPAGWLRGKGGALVKKGAPAVQGGIEDKSVRDALGCLTHKCAEVRTYAPVTEEVTGALDRVRGRRPGTKTRYTYFDDGTKTKRSRPDNNPFYRAPVGRKKFAAAKWWPIRCYIKKGAVMGDIAMSSTKWAREKARQDLCGKPESPWFVAGLRDDGRTFCGPQQCHAKRHRNCRPSKLRETIEANSWGAMLTVTDRNREKSEEWVDLRHLASGKRISRFFNLWDKKWGRPKYLWVKECHVSGHPHIHILLNFSLCGPGLREWVNPNTGKTSILSSLEWEEEIAELWKICGGGYNVRLEKLKGNGAYIAKYPDAQHSTTERIQALIHYNKLRDWGCSKGLKRQKRSDTRWRTKRAPKDEAKKWEEYCKVKGETPEEANAAKEFTERLRKRDERRKAPKKEAGPLTGAGFEAGVMAARGRGKG